MVLHCFASYHFKDVSVAFVDYEKAFHRVHWPKLMEVLAKFGVNYGDRKMIWNLYMNQTASVTIDGELSDPAIIGRQPGKVVKQFIDGYQIEQVSSFCYLFGINGYGRRKIRERNQM